MTHRLEGNTASLVLSNSHALVIKLNDEADKIEAQFVGSETIGEIIEADIVYERYEDEEDTSPCFYLDAADTEPYWIRDFMRDNYMQEVMSHVICRR